jgi:hypothetical protein
MSQQSSGLSASEVRSMIRSEVGPLEGQVSRLDSRLNQLENEMANVERAIVNMAKNLGSQLGALQQATREGLNANASHLERANNRLANVEAVTRDGLARNEAVTRDGLEQTKVATLGVKGEVALNTVSVERGTTTQLQMEFLRIHAEGQAAARRIAGFATEVDERFAKSLESVTLNRSLYDKHFESIHVEFDNKMRTIGEHIYRIYDEDFLPVVENRLKVPRIEYQALPLAVDEERVNARSEQLDANLAEIRSETLEPLLALHADFEQTMKSRFALGKGVPDQERLLVPAAVAVGPDNKVEVVVDASLRKKSNDAVRINLAKRGRLPAISEQLSANGTARTLSQQLQWRALDAKELLQVAKAIGALQTEGLIDEEYATDLKSYLDTCGLRVSVSGSVTNDGLVNRGD